MDTESNPFEKNSFNATLKLAPYRDQKKNWPSEGRHILAQSDEDTIVVYQAYNKTIGNYAVQHQKFLGCSAFSPDRMTWVKTNFLWMMYRCDWGTKDKNQQVVLAIWMKKSAFQKLLEVAVHSSYQPGSYGSLQMYKDTVKQAQANESKFGFVRLQWDPDHSPSGSPHPGRRAIQLGMKKVKSFVNGSDIVQIKDITDFVASQKALLDAGIKDIQTPLEEVYTDFDEYTRQRVRISHWDPITRIATDPKNLFEVPKETLQKKKNNNTDPEPDLEDKTLITALGH